ncbi:MAG TPA: tripartite tricarboxylate transporter substrate binding protein [Burkholderiaceae bacterium]|nr:tripartite tricarboxylate transporter substrate binding protein [Burkholderiaceae bacterium]
MSSPIASFLRRLAALCLLAWAGNAAAQAGTVRLIVAAPPGGITDVFARLLAEPLQAQLKQAVIVDNKPGGSGAIAMRALLSAPANGLTLLLATPTSLTLPPLLKEPAVFDPRRDVLPVARIAGGGGLLVVPSSLPVNSVQELVAYAKARPGQLNFGSAGNASSNHLAMELFRDRLGLDIVHVPYSGAVPAINGLLSGQVQVYMGDLGSLEPQLRAGRLRALAQIGSERSPLYPYLPTLGEGLLPGYQATFWLGIVAREGTPAAAVGRLNAAVNAAMATEAPRRHAATIGFAVHQGPPKDLADTIDSDLTVWGDVIRKHHITAP